MDITSKQFKSIVTELFNEKFEEHGVSLDDEAIEEIAEALLEKLEEAEIVAAGDSE